MTEVKTTYCKEQDAHKEYWIVDAKDQILGRLAVKVASVLRGKHKPTFEPSADNGDFVIVVNAASIRLTGKKEDQKEYKHHSLYPGGLKVRSFKEQKKRFPDRIIEEAVQGMLPKNTLGRSQLKKLKVYAGETHPHQAQKPKFLAI